MFLHRVLVPRLKSPARDYEPSGELQLLLGAWRNNGQIYGNDWPSVPEEHGYSTIVMCPESDSLDARFNSRYVTEAIAQCEKEGQRVTWQALGGDLDTTPACGCTSSSAYILFTTYLGQISPVHCMDCFLAVGLYRFSPMRSGDFYEVIGWESNYQSCDSLQMHCTVLERAATRELSHIDSKLTQQGRGICSTLAASSGRPFYYYLYRGSGRSHRAELERRCPSCGGEWRLASQLHHLFDFKCERCNLLSNVAFNVRA